MNIFVKAIICLHLKFNVITNFVLKEQILRFFLFFNQYFNINVILIQFKQIL